MVLHDGTMLLVTETAMWRSQDGAGTWEVTNGSHTSFTGGLIQLSPQHPTHPGRLLGVHKSGSGVGQIKAQTAWSDDGGLSWQESKTMQAHMDESEVVELADGGIALLSRCERRCSSDFRFSD